MLRSTFAGFTTAQHALAANQRAIDVAGQNLSNQYTVGYTRQRLDLVSITPVGNSSTSSAQDSKVGQGVMMTGISQVRDPFLDVQYRNQITKVGTADAMDEILAQVGAIFDETDSTAIRAALNDVVSQMNNVASTANTGESSDDLIRSSFEVLLNLVYQNGTQIETVRGDIESEIEDSFIPGANQILDKITQLNKSIKNSQVLGNPALELQDERNLLLDDLATYFPIEVKYSDIGFGVDSLEVSLKGSDGSKHVLISDGEKGNMLFGKTVNGNATLTFESIDGATSTNITDILGEGVLKANYDMLNKAEVFDGTDVKGVGYYEGMFNSFVHTMATTMNKLNGDGKPLFSTLDGSDQFTATNIKVSDEWKTGKVSITKTLDPDLSTGNENILRMINALTKDEIEFEHTREDGSKVKIFQGTIQELYDGIQNTQAIERSSSSSILSNRLSVLNQIADSRDAVSAVNQDEEVMDLMQHQQSYNAASRLMTTLDELLDKLINGTGVVGR